MFSQSSSQQGYKPTVLRLPGYPDGVFAPVGTPLLFGNERPFQLLINAFCFIKSKIVVLHTEQEFLSKLIAIKQTKSRTGYPMLFLSTRYGTPTSLAKPRDMTFEVAFAGDVPQHAHREMPFTIADLNTFKRYKLKPIAERILEAM